MSELSEKWKYIQGWEGFYMISSFGRVSGVSRDVEDSRGHCRRISSKILAGGTNTAGYRRIQLTKLGKECDEMIHRLVATAFLDNPEGKPQVNHKNGIKDDNREENLEWCTSSENIAHAYATGLRNPPTNVVGSDNPRAKLSDNDVRFIRYWSECGYNGKDIAAVFNVNPSTVSMILLNKTWTHIK